MNANISPNVIAIDIADEPPYDMNGKVIPLVGIIPRLTAILIPTWIQIRDISPIDAILANKSS